MRRIRDVEPLSTILSLLYPPACAVCSADVERESHLCPACAKKLTRIVAPFCAKCSEQFYGAIEGEFTCVNCAHRHLDFDAAVSAYRSRGIVRRVIHDFKYGHQVHLQHLIVDWLAEAMRDPRLEGRTFHAIIPVPLHSARERERGFNQAALLAKLLGRTSGIPVQDALNRVRYTTTQTAFDRAERIENLRGAFQVRENSDVRNMRLLLVDDVLTTGSTLSECARVLKKSGALSVHAITAARG